MFRGRSVAACLAGLLTVMVFASPAPAALILYTEGVPNGVASGGATGAGFGSPVIEDFQSFAFPGSIALADSPPGFAGGTTLGTPGNPFRIGTPGDGAAPTFRPFAGEAGNTGITLGLTSTAPGHSLVAGGGLVFESLGLRMSDVGSTTTNDGLVLTAYADLAGTTVVGTFSVDLDSVTAQFIETNEVAFLGLRQDGVGAPVLFARLDVRLAAGGLQIDSVQIDGIRGVLVPVPPALVLGLTGALGLWVGRRRLRAA
jgi:hypothetical protein